MKNYVWRKTLQMKAGVTNLQEFVNVAQPKFPSFVITACLSKDICKATAFLNDCYKSHSKSIPKTHTIHHIEIVDGHVVL